MILFNTSAAIRHMGHQVPCLSGRSQIAVPIATSKYHAKRLQDLAGASCRQRSMEMLSNNIFFDGRKVRWRKERWAVRRVALQQAGWLSRVSEVRECFPVKPEDPRLV
ncbi:hypothetical protein [Caldanaerovirga acetigignens]|uniref:hypothetical protein n=1 Tax=Caldanaerovirga acetigignens TaxID=447595 RepID=UPI0018E0A309|nr:hypothetical protein [Caldanaerovirga acetigignens]